MWATESSVRAHLPNRNPVPHRQPAVASAAYARAFEIRAISKVTAFFSHPVFCQVTAVLMQNDETFIEVAAKIRISSLPYELDITDNTLDFASPAEARPRWRN